MPRTLLPRLGVAVCVFVGLFWAFPERPWHWDEFQLAYALYDFDLTRHQPHPPGYYLFVVLGRMLAALLGEPFLALRCISAASIAAFAALAVGAPAQGSARLARALWFACAAAFALASPLTQRFGVAALTYAAAGAVWLAWLLAFARRRDARGRIGLAAAAGLAGGLRPTLTLWAAAMLLADVVRRRNWRASGGLALAGAAGMACWVVPLLWEAGGIAAYRSAAGPLSTGNVWAKSVFAAGFEGWASRLATMALDLASSLGGLGVAVLATAFLRARQPRPMRDPDAVLLVGAALAFSFYALVLYDTPGYLLAVALPLAAWTLRTAAASTATWPPAAQAAAASATLALIGLGTLTPGDRLDVHQTDHARRLEARFAPVRNAFDPRTTVLVTSREYWDYGLRHVGDALPEFTTLQLARDPYFSISDEHHPYLTMHARRLDGVGPDPLDLASLAPEGALAQVVYMVPFDAQEFVARTCGELAQGLVTASGETLPVLRLHPGWRVEARHQRLHCVRVGQP